MATTNGFLFTNDDIEYLRSAYLLGLATIDQLAALSWRNGQPRSYSCTQKRVLKLAQQGYLAPLTKPPRKTLYTLGKQGIETLIAIGYAPEELRNRRPRDKELKDLFIGHTILVKDIQVKLMTLLHGTSIRLARWSEGPEIFDSVTIHNKSTAERIPIRPDALFVLYDMQRPEGRNTISFVLEADRSTESHERIHTKIKGYLAYTQQGLAVGKWQLKSKHFRVAVVTQTTARADNLRTHLQSFVPADLRSHYLFMPLDALSLGMLIS